MITVQMVCTRGFEQWAVFFQGCLVPRSQRWSQAEAERLAAWYVAELDRLVGPTVV